jgi:citronellol/citronellal dehydrogenase
MTMVAHGLAREVQESGVSINALWPATFIESFATKNFKMSERREWRKADIVADSVAAMLAEDSSSFNGRAVIDEEYLRTRGVSDFRKYRCVPDYEPVKVWPVPVDGELGNDTTAKIGVPPGIQARL